MVTRLYASLNKAVQSSATNSHGRKAPRVAAVHVLNKLESQERWEAVKQRRAVAYQFDIGPVVPIGKGARRGEGWGRSWLEQGGPDRRCRAAVYVLPAFRGIVPAATGGGAWGGTRFSGSAPIFTR